jgi:hypothetical protein
MLLLCYTECSKKEALFLRGYCVEFLQRKPFRSFTTEHIVAEVWAQSGVFDEVLDTILE